MVIVVIRKARFTCHGISHFVISLLILVYCIIIGLGTTARDGPQTSQREEILTLSNL